MWCGASRSFFDTPQGTFLPALSLGRGREVAERAGSADRATRWRHCGGSVHSHRVADVDGAQLLREALGSGERDLGRRRCSTARSIRSSVAGKIVFIGATDPLSGDVRLAPTNKSSRLPGVFLHANAANTILTGTYLEPVDRHHHLALGRVPDHRSSALLVLMLPLWLSPLITVAARRSGTSSSSSGASTTA